MFVNLCEAKKVKTDTHMRTHTHTQIKFTQGHQKAFPELDFL